MIETENHGMSLIRNRRGFLGVLSSALLALALFDPRAATAQEAKQIKLTEKHIQGMMAAYKDMAKLYEGMNSDKPDPQVEAQAEAIAKKNGLVCNMEASLYEPINTYKAVAPNIGIVDGPFEYLTVGGVKLPLPFTTRMTATSSCIRRSSSTGDWPTSCWDWGRFVISCRLTNSTMRI
jgi:hypothetical protein